MTAPTPPAGRSLIPFEALLACAIAVALGMVASRFVQNGYLPQPFYYHVSDTFMDLFSTAYWAHNAGAYGIWHSLYPPLSFIFLRLFSQSGCYRLSGVTARDCDPLPLAVLFLFFLLNLGLVYANYRRVDRRTALPRAAAMSFGLPMLYALERGNLLIPCFTAFVLGYGVLLRGPRARWLALGLAINFKPYLLVSLFPYLLRRQWLWLAGAAVAGLLIYLLTFLILGAGTPWQILVEESRYAVASSKGYFSDLYYATSYWPLIRLLNEAPTGLALASPGVARAIALALTILLRGAQVGAAGCIAAALFRPAAVDVRRFGALVAALSLTTFTTGSAGYAQIFLFFLILFESWRGPARIAILVSTYLLCLPVDWVFLPLHQDPAMSFLGGRVVTPKTGVSVGQLVRPAVLLVIQYGLILINLQDILVARPRTRARAEARSPPPAPA